MLNKHNDNGFAFHKGVNGSTPYRKTKRKKKEKETVPVTIFQSSPVEENQAPIIYAYVHQKKNLQGTKIDEKVVK